MKKTFTTKFVAVIIAITTLLGSAIFFNTASAQDSNLTVTFPLPSPIATKLPAKLDTDSSPVAAKPIKLLCLGDSITHGCGVTDEPGAKHYHTSYRYPLWKKFIDNNYNVEFVGNRNMNFNQNCTEAYSEYKGYIFNNRHEAHYGITLYDIINGYMPTSANESKAVPPLKEEIANLDFDAVVINLGTNTRTVNGETVETWQVKVDEMKQVVDILRQKNPNVVIYITQLLALDTFSELNIAYQEIADTMSTDKSPIICIRTKNPRWNTEDFYLSYIDGIHPDADGDDYLSEIVLNYMRPLLEGSTYVKSVTEPFKIYPVEKPIKPKKIKLITKRITKKTRIIKGKTNVKKSDIIVKIGKKVIAETITNKKGFFKARVKLKKYKLGKKITFQAIKYYEAYDYSEIIKKSPVLTVKIIK